MAYNSLIKVTCKCGKEIKINVKTIDTLSAENKRLTEEIANLKCKIVTLEIMKDSGNSGSGFNFNDYGDMFGDIFKK